MAPDSSTLAWKILWTEEPGRLQSMGLRWVGHDWATSLSLFTFMHWRRKWQPSPVFFAWRISGTGEPDGLPSMGSHRFGHDWNDLAAAGLYSPWDSLARILEWVEFPFSRGIFPTQGLSPSLPHFRHILYQLSHEGNRMLQNWMLLSIFKYYVLGISEQDVASK